MVRVDPNMYIMSHAEERVNLMSTVSHPSNPHRICSCGRCEEPVYSQAVKPKFAGYTQINPIRTPTLSDHQYFLCDQRVEAFVFKTREWSSKSGRPIFPRV